MLMKNLPLLLLLGFVFVSSNIYAQQSQAEKYYDESKEYFKKGDWEEVVISCKKAIEIDPNYVSAYFAMGRAYTLLGKPKDAVAMFEKALSIDSNYAAAYLGLGVVYRFMGEYQKGVTALKKALDIDPNNSNAYVALAGIYMELSQFKEALLLLDKAKGIDTDYGDIYTILGDVYRCLNQIEKAKENYQKGISVYRSQGLEGLAKGYEKKLNYIEDSYVIVYLKPEKRTIIKGVIIEDTETSLKVKGDTSMGAVDGFILLKGGEQKIDKKDIDHIELKP